jgi:phosphoadenosine phosphosulfate reductase
VSPDGATRARSLADGATRALADAVRLHAGAVFTTSLGVEDMVVLDLIARANLPVDVITLDTGRLHEETYALLDAARARYGLAIRALSPDAAELEAFVAQHGVNSFYRGIGLRKRCCEIRKLGPLRRALAGRGLWITGLRRAQSATRAGIALLEHDAAHGVAKLNPLVEWRDDEVWSYAQAFDVPTSALHARGFPSIGCAPCTRAVTAGEDPRAGRWWWEQPETRECGLHMSPDGRLVRAIRPVPAEPQPT